MADQAPENAALRPPMVWREDNRIRRADGVGYGDVVPDEDIWTHLAGHVEKRDAAACSTCEDTGVVHMEGQIGAPGSGGDFPCPDCTDAPWEPIDV